MNNVFHFEGVADVPRDTRSDYVLDILAETAIEKRDGGAWKLWGLLK